jgi:hypothetical protein
MKKIILILSLLAFTGSMMQTNAEIINGARITHVKLLKKHHKKVHHKKHHRRKRKAA